MIEIDYRLSPPWNEGKATLDLAAADEMQLRYHAFPGDQILRIDGVDFSAAWGWVPLLDFAAALVHAATRIATTQEEAVGFTENEALIVLRSKGQFVEIAASYADGRATVGHAELVQAGRNYAVRLLEVLCAQFPELRTNKSLKRWYPA
jgi:hypothetical protein